MDVSSITRDERVDGIEKRSHEAERPPSPLHVARATIEYIHRVGYSFFFLTSLPPSTRTKARDERAVKTANSYMQTALHYATEICIFSRAICWPDSPFRRLSNRDIEAP
ncbi:uncharacterized protein LOC143147401 [Ptiloglossa arizonensis]|uniref:uncharacterized protein LOC143147401 n=1 Tax=Ptiloglossa arizonensis TaxID=3350558 RepID=UPI003FA06DD5